MKKIIFFVLVVCFVISCSNSNVAPVSTDAGVTVVQDTIDAGVDASTECVQE